MTARRVWHIEWCPPGECWSFWTWLLYAWDFFGQEGHIVGFRICGLGVERRPKR